MKKWIYGAIGLAVIIAMVGTVMGEWAYSNWNWQNSPAPISNTTFSIGLHNFNQGIYYENFSVNHTSLFNFSYQYIVNGHLSSVPTESGFDLNVATYMILSSNQFSSVQNATNGYLGSQFPGPVLTTDPNNAILQPGNYTFVLSTNFNVSVLISQFSTHTVNLTGGN